jgi:hypothetical protein
MQRNNDDIAPGIDEHMIRQPLAWWRRLRRSTFRDDSVLVCHGVATKLLC